MSFEELKKTPIYPALSNFGKRIYLPNGIFYWAGLAKKAANINATIGTAKGSELPDLMTSSGKGKVTFYLKNLQNLVAGNIDPSVIASYAPIAGLPDLRKKWKSWIIKKSGIERVKELAELISIPIVTSGLTNGLHLVIRLFASEGENVIICNKRWGNYDTIIRYNVGAGITNFETFDNKEFNTSEMSEKTKETGEKQGKIILLLNFPNNPTGYCPTQDTMEKIAESLKSCAEDLEKPIIVICDDAYEGYVYDKNAEKRSLFPFLLDQSPYLIPVKIDGASKELLFYGGRVGFITFGFSSEWNVDLTKAASELENKVAGAIRSTISNTAHLSQKIVLKLLDDLESCLSNRQQVIKILEQRWKVIKEKSNEIEDPDRGILFDPFQGGFFAFLNLPSSMPADKFAKNLLENYKVGVIPISNPSTAVNGIRIAYCSMAENEIENALKLISNLLLQKSA
ncbi:MAG: aminotransferase class I/II-fold pyridoxal phosphate-dependent enzyme [Promethearchaeota archaeon]